MVHSSSATFVNESFLESKEADAFASISSGVNLLAPQLVRAAVAATQARISVNFFIWKKIGGLVNEIRL